MRTVKITRTTAENLIDIDDDIYICSPTATSRGVAALIMVKGIAQKLGETILNVLLVS